MKTSEKRTKLHRLIDNMSGKKINALYTILENTIESRKDEVSISREIVKAELINEGKIKIPKQRSEKRK